MLSLEASYEAIRHGAVARVVARDFVRVAGLDARSFLQGQCTQDISALESGASTESLLLSPQGKFEAAVRISLLAPDLLLLDTEEGWGEAVFERLRRFKLRVKVTLEAERGAAVEVRGPKAVIDRADLARGALALAPVSWPGLVGFDLIGPDPIVPIGLELGDGAAFEAARIEAGWPLPGRELTEKTIPQEAGIAERTVSFTKGCYTGQELVARLDARGNNVAWRLRGLRLEGDAPPAVGASIEVDEREIGHLTSIAYSPGAKGWIGLCYLRRDAQPPLVVSVAGQPAEALELPFVQG